MEELNLGDLSFDTDSLGLFDENGNQETKAPAGNKPAADGTPPASDNDGKGIDDNTNSDGEGDPKDSSESVAGQDKDKNNQVQAGKTADSDEGGNSSSPKLNETEQLYSNLAAEFIAKGVLPELDVTKIKSLKDIEDAIQQKINDSLTDKQKAIDEAVKAGAPVNQVTQMHNTIEKLEKVTPEFIGNENNIEFRRTAIAQDFIDKGYDVDRAKSLAQRSIDAGTDVEDAEFALKNLIASERTKLKSTIDAAKEKETRSLNDIKDYISSTPEVLPGIALTDSQKDQLYNQITTEVDNKENAFIKAQKADPIGSRIKLEAIFMLTDGLKDLSVFGNKAETKASNKIENLLRGTKFTEDGKVDTNVADPESNFKLSDLKDLEIE